MLEKLEKVSNSILTLLGKPREVRLDRWDEDTDGEAGLAIHAGDDVAADDSHTLKVGTGHTTTTADMIS